jgi:hypothetical protein
MSCSDSDDQSLYSSQIEGRESLENNCSIDTSKTYIFDDDDSFSEFLETIGAKINETDTLVYEYSNDPVNNYTLKSVIDQKTVTGFTEEVVIQGLEDISIIFKDFASCDKYKLSINVEYFLSIHRVRKIEIFLPNERPSVLTSPECGLIIDNPNRSNWRDAPIGYKGVYYPEYSDFVMTTYVLHFRINTTTDVLIWYPCKLENLKWRINILRL